MTKTKFLIAAVVFIFIFIFIGLSSKTAKQSLGRTEIKPTASTSLPTASNLLSPKNGLPTSSTSFKSTTIPPSVKQDKYLILFDITAGPLPTPSFVQKNQDYLSTLPFDGLAVYLQNDEEANAPEVSAHLMSTTPVTYEDLNTILAPIKNLHSTTLKQNFAYVIITDKLPDFFDDEGWAIIKQNFVNLAKAAKDNGLKGIFLDTEDYGYDENPPTPSFAYPMGVKYADQKTLQKYQAQARWRGQQIMEAVAAEYPELVMMTTIGPYASESTLPENTFGYSKIKGSDELNGPFFVGLIEGMGPKSTVVDGGELYDLRTVKEFQDTYNWRKHTIASEDINSSFIPNSLRPEWADRISVGFGLYDSEVDSQTDQWRTVYPTVAKTTVSNALKQTDQYVWFYDERITFLQPPGTHPKAASQEWIEVIKAGRRLAR